MIVDAHLHLFRHGYGRFPRASPLGTQADVDAYEAHMIEQGISTGLVVCYEADDIDPRNNDYVRELAQTRPWIASVAYLEAAQPPLPSDVARLLDHGHIGIAIYLPNKDAASMLGLWPEEVWHMLSARHAIVSLNARPEAITELGRIIAGAPCAQFLFSHLGLPGSQEHRPSAAVAARRLEPLLRLAGRGNVGVKISGLYAIDPVPPHAGARPFVDVLLDRLPLSDLHWGSDFSPALGFVDLRQTLELDALVALPPADSRMIMGKGLAEKLRLAAGANLKPWSR